MPESLKDKTVKGVAWSGKDFPMKNKFTPPVLGLQERRSAVPIWSLSHHCHAGYRGASLCAEFKHELSAYRKTVLY